MSAMCTMNGCKAKNGLCAHEKMMAMMALVGVVLAGAHWGLHLF